MVNTSSVANRKQESKAFQLILSLILFAGFVIFLFVPNTIFAGITSTDQTKKLSLFFLILDTVKNLKTYDLAYDHLYYAILSVAAFYVVLIVLTIIAQKKKKKGTTAINFINLCFGFAVFTYFLCAIHIDTLVSFKILIQGNKELEIPAITSTNLALLLSVAGLIIVALAANKGIGFVKVIYALFGLSFFAFLIYQKAFYLGAPLEIFFYPNLIPATGTLQKITYYAFCALAYFAVLNLALSLLSLTNRGMRGLDIFRSVIFFILAAVCLILQGVDTGFKTLPDSLGTICFAGIALGQMIYSFIASAIIKSSNRRRADKEVKFEIEKNQQMQIVLPDEQQNAEQPEAAAEPETVSESASRINDAFEDAAQLSIDEIVTDEAETEKEPPVYDEAIRDIPTEATEEIAEEKPFDFAQAQHDGQFNREYTDYENQKATESQNAQQPTQPHTPPYPNYAGYGAYAQPYMQQPPYAQGMASAYAFPPDAFINSLTPAERDEFDKLFISRIYGENKRLPVYTVGADNREFFSKIFVFMGRYRNIISDGLLEKIYNYSNSIR